jgi:ribosome-binding protein aMBF1 (putative translation factor)
MNRINKEECMSAEVIPFRRKRPTKREPYKRRSAEQQRKRDEFWRAVGERLQYARRMFGISEREAAAALFVTLRTYRKGERGQRHRENVVNYARTYCVTLDWLCGGAGPPPRFRLRAV